MAYNYIKCKACEWSLNNDPNINWDIYPCIKCNNTRLVIDPKEILCNLCGEYMSDINQDPLGLYNAEVIGGYSSYYLLDMNKYTFSLCEKCLRSLFIQCKIKPNIQCLLDSSEESWNNDQRQYEYRVWKDTDGHHNAYLNNKCNTIKDCPHTAIYSVLFYNEFTEDCVCETHKSYFKHNASAK